MVKKAWVKKLHVKNQFEAEWFLLVNLIIYKENNFFACLTFKIFIMSSTGAV